MQLHSIVHDSHNHQDQPGQQKHGQIGQAFVESLAKRMRQNHQGPENAGRRQEHGNSTPQGHGAPVELAVLIRLIDQAEVDGHASHQRRERKTGYAGSHNGDYCDGHHVRVLHSQLGETRRAEELDQSHPASNVS